MPSSSSTQEVRAGEPALRVLIATPTEGDAAAVTHVLSEGGFTAEAFAGVAEIGAELERGGHTTTGAVVLAQEAIGAEGCGSLARLRAILGAQPQWSDLPLVLLAGSAAGGDVAWAIARELDPVGNITILERPLRRTTLLNAVNVALRARVRQFALRATLEELKEHREHLRELVDRKTAELAASTASLRASERLASLGTLAAGLGHDIANLALPIRARLDALSEVCRGEESRADLQAIGTALAHLSQLAAGMRLMGLDPDRESASAPAVDLAEWLEETAPMLRASLPRHVRLVRSIAPGLGVRASRHRLAQAVFNLVQNAGEAMSARSHGRVSLSAAEGTDREGRPVVILRVEDDGPGMSPEVLGRCFEPYFSTKGRAIATGMGLGMVKGIVEAAGGSVSVASTVGKGTTFELAFPAIRSEGLEESGAPRAGAVSLRNERTARLACMLLEQMGLAWVRHEGANAPREAAWILDEARSDGIEEYLGSDARRRVILIDGSSNGKVEGAAHARREQGSRITVIRGNPTPRALRDAIGLLRTSGVGAQGGQQS